MHYFRGETILASSEKIFIACNSPSSLQEKQSSTDGNTLEDTSLTENYGNPIAAPGLTTDVEECSALPDVEREENDQCSSKDPIPSDNGAVKNSDGIHFQHTPAKSQPSNSLSLPSKDSPVNKEAVLSPPPVTSPSCKALSPPPKGSLVSPPSIKDLSSHIPCSNQSSSTSHVSDSSEDEAALHFKLSDDKNRAQCPYLLRFTIKGEKSFMPTCSISVEWK